MYPPIFQTCVAAIAVRTVFGTSPTRLYPFGEAPQDVALPYAVWQIVGGSPENYIGETPDVDRLSVQVDVYGETPTAARAAAEALRNAIEPVAYITAWCGESTDKDTGRKRFSFDVEWHVSR